MNPCPCGQPGGENGLCHCTTKQVSRLHRSAFLANLFRQQQFRTQISEILHGLCIAGDIRLILWWMAETLVYPSLQFGYLLGVSEKVARRLRDLDHPSRIDRLEAALACLGKQLELSVRPIAARTTGLIEVRA